MMAWVGLVLTSFVVFMSAARICQADGCQGDSSMDRRVKFAVAVGVISTAVSLLWMFLGARVHAMIDGFVGLCLLVFWVRTSLNETCARRLASKSPLTENVPLSLFRSLALSSSRLEEETLLLWKSATSTSSRGVAS